jgi:excisionase family DNA binding protein
MSRSRKAPAETPRLETIQRAAERNAISVDTVRRLIARGDLKAYRLGERIIRVDLAEVDSLFRPIPTVRNGS